MKHRAGLRRTMVGFAGPTLPENLRKWLNDGLFGVFLFPPNGNYESRDQVRAVCDAIHTANPDAIIAVDQEGGRVQAWGPPHFPAQPSARELGRMPTAQVREQGRVIGRELAALGVDLDFAPVLDVDTEARNPIIGDRSFGDDAALVIEKARAFAAGLEDVGVLSCGKHFPGHGDTTRDSHLELPVVAVDRARLDTMELVPFAAMAKSTDDGPALPTLMSAHIDYKALDAGVPATHSRAVMTDLLRGELGYAGVLFSDDLAMKGIRADCELPEAAVRALAAGCDVALSAFEMDQHEAMFHAIDAAIDAGTIPAEQHAASLVRIAALIARKRAIQCS